jgi:hypothetical protein
MCCASVCTFCWCYGMIFGTVITHRDFPTVLPMYPSGSTSFAQQCRAPLQLQQAPCLPASASKRRHCGPPQLTSRLWRFTVQIFAGAASASAQPAAAACPPVCPGACCIRHMPRPQPPPPHVAAMPLQQAPPSAAPLAGGRWGLPPATCGVGTHQVLLLWASGVVWFSSARTGSNLGAKALLVP